MRVKFLLLIMLISISAAAAEKAIVKSIFDGDTIAVISRGEYIKVRLIGIDTPESRSIKKASKYFKRNGKDVGIIIMQGRHIAALCCFSTYFSRFC